MADETMVLYRASVDNVGRFVDAGTEVVVSDAPAADAITADRVDELADTGGAVTQAEAVADDWSPESADAQPGAAEQTSEPEASAPEPSAKTAA